jgi:peptidoglycan/xylan/chitin deacetylase (PgdA/CDA1 family)
VKATFFINGEAIIAFGETLAKKAVEQIRDEGHSIGNHGWSHTNRPDFNRLEEWLANLDIRTRLIRPPRGDKICARDYLAAHPDATPYNWNVQFDEWRGPIDWALAIQQLTTMPSGSIMLLHDGALQAEHKDRTEIPNAVDKVIAICAQRGLPLAPLPM